MKTLKKHLGKVLDKLVDKRHRVSWQYRRWKVWDRKADRAHEAALDLRARADRERAAGNHQAAAALDGQAIKRQAKADKFRALARIKVGRIKILKRHVLKLDRLADQLRDEIEEWIRENRVKVDVLGNRVTGGTDKQRFRTAALTSSKRCLTGKRPNWYSMLGGWIVSKCFTGEPSGSRSDCSQWLTSVCLAAGLPDPNGTNWTGGWTGTLVEGHNGWHQCSEADMKRKGFGYVVYGYGPGHHVEAFVGPGEKDHQGSAFANLTIGHGSAPIDPGVIDLFGDGNYRCFTLN